MFGLVLTQDGRFECIGLPEARLWAHNAAMTTRLIALLGAGTLASWLFAAAPQSPPASQPASQPAAASLKLPADDTGAEAALKASPRHGEWVDINIPAAEDMPAFKLHTWVVYPERKDKAPVVLVIHEIFGMTDWVRSVADQLAAEGFIAIVPDLLSGRGPDGGGTASFKGDDVRNAIRELTEDEVNPLLDAAREYGLALPSASAKSATVGFCWGGSRSFDYAVHQPKLNGAVVYYGSGPQFKEMLQPIQCPVLGFYGMDDARVTTTVEPTARAMTAAKKQYTHLHYDGAGHGFLRQRSGSGSETRDYANLKAAQQAWAATIEFLNKNLQ